MTRNIEQHHKIDILSLFANSNHTEWNKFLTQCYTNRDVSKLISTLNGLQLGMADLANQKMNTEKVNVFFIRLCTSIEKTLKKIYREVYPQICDDPLKAKDNLTRISEKRARDLEFERFLRRHRY